MQIAKIGSTGFVCKLCSMARAWESIVQKHCVTSIAGLTCPPLSVLSTHCDLVSSANSTQQCRSPALGFGFECTQGVSVPICATHRPKVCRTPASLQMLQARTKSQVCVWSLDGASQMQVLAQCSNRILSVHYMHTVKCIPKIRYIAAILTRHTQLYLTLM